MSIISTSGIDRLAKAYAPSAGSYVKRTKSADGLKEERKTSVVDEYKKKHPEDARHVEQQVKAGRAVRLKNGVPNASTEDMTMEEYKNYFHALLDTIPYDATRVNDVTMISISEAGWEQMKKDPDYEAWILGYFVEDRAVRNPFFGWGGNDGSFCVEKFGASIEEHHGQGFSKSSVIGAKTDKDEESWWTKRRKKTKQLMEEQAERAQQKAKAKKVIAQEEFVRQQYQSRQRLHSFLVSDGKEILEKPVCKDTDASAAAAVYSSLFDLFGSKDVKSTNL